MNHFIFTKFAKRKFEKLSPEIQEYILEKLRELKKYKNLGTHLKKLKDVEPATHRLRIGNYRLIMEWKTKTRFIVLDVGHRKEIY